ncbi:bifunctional DNA primase/polymerase [Alicyclobacillus tolerans]|uniref:bifunctional DNA primase/polymerase n=1 Tax=Alicyclobacillus tolerans TaxID=90970 RepID=UPI001F4154D4|nr:bifunctional DNA primase/polymerase [Alicyclobacillus tolerans]MCF8564984.1 bifunctional DNA primase/polymerase [Alicyclobacillus tolerans]
MPEHDNHPHVQFTPDIGSQASGSRPTTKKKSSIPVEIQMLIAMGIKVFPVYPRSKIPIIKDWNHRASSDPKQVLVWAICHANCSWGALMGKPSGVIAIDADDLDDLRHLESKCGELPEGPTQITGRLGEHRVFRYPTGVDEIVSAIKLEKRNVDVRADDAFIVVSPSVHGETGRTYEWDAVRHPESMPLPELPEKWIEFLKSQHDTNRHARKVRSSVPWKSVPNDDIRRLVPKICPRMDYFASKRGAVDATYDDWIGMASVGHALTDDDTLFHEWSAADEGRFNKWKTGRKWRNTADMSPRSCHRMQADHPLDACLKCPFFERNKNPSYHVRVAYGQEQGGRGPWGAPPPTPEELEERRKKHDKEREAYMESLQGLNEVAAGMEATAPKIDVTVDDYEGESNTKDDAGQSHEDYDAPHTDKQTDKDQRIAHLTEQILFGVKQILDKTKEPMDVKDEMIWVLIELLKLHPFKYEDSLTRLAQAAQKINSRTPAFTRTSLDKEIKWTVKKEKEDGVRREYQLATLNNGYYREQSDGEGISTYDRVTNFHLSANEVLEIDNIESIFDMSVKVYAEIERNREMQVDSKAFNDAKLFKQAVLQHDMTFDGESKDVMALKRIIIAQQPSVIRATRAVGFHGQTFVWEEGQISRDGEEKLRVVPFGNSTKGIVNWSEYNETFWRALAKEICVRIWDVNHRTKVALAMGWMMASVFAPVIRQSMPNKRSFPLLELYGTRGSGKTSLTTLITRMLRGNDKVVGCKDTKFPKLHGLASQNSLPFVLDEYRRSEMTAEEVNYIHNLLKRAYDSETSERGRSNQTIVEYPLVAPVIVLGESQFNIDALVERTIFIHMDKEVTETPKYQDVHSSISSLSLERFGEGLIRMAIEQDWLGLIPSLFQKNLSSVRIQERDYREENPGSLGLIERQQLNLATVFTGLDLWKRLANEVHAEFESPLPDADELRTEYMNGIYGGQSPLNPIDKLMQATEVILNNPRYREGVDYGMYGIRDVRIHAKSWHDALTRYYRDMDRKYEIQDWEITRSEILSMIGKEGSYVIALKPLELNGKTQRVLQIDAEILQKKLDIDPKNFDCTI